MLDPFLIAASFVTSACTAVVGVGGGTLLISVMPGSLPIAAIVPVHGVVQFASNLSRAAFAHRRIQWRLVRPFVLGAAIGALAGSFFVESVPTEWLPILLGSFILVVTWLPRPRAMPRIPAPFVQVGAVQTFASLFVGIAGPLNVAPLLREGLSRDELVATDAAMNTSLHGIKVATFVVLGFAYAEWLPLIGAMVVAVSLGSWVGTHLRARVPERPFRFVLRWLLTALAIRILVRGLTGGAV